MKVIILLTLFLNTFGLLYAGDGQNNELDNENPSGMDLEEKREPETQRTPLVMMSTFKGYSLPKDVYMKKGERMFKGTLKYDFKYLCPLEDQEKMHAQQETNSETKQLYLGQCLFEKKIQGNEPKCSKEIVPQLSSIVNKKDEPKRCGQNKEGTLYAFSYLVCNRVNSYRTVMDRKNINEELSTKHITIYQFCFNHQEKTTIYTWHEILSPRLLKYIELMGEFAQYTSRTIDTENFGKFGDAFTQMVQDFKLDTSIVPHMFVPPADMAFNTWRKPTYHYANVTAMSPEISSLWDFIDNRIRLIAMNKDIIERFHIYMGEFISNGYRFWCKIVHETETAYAAAIIVSEYLPDSLNVVKTCKTEYCDFKRWGGYKNELKVEWAKCCIVSRRHIELFGLKRLQGIHLDESTFFLGSIDKPPF